MARKPAHPDKQLFDYLSGALDASAFQEVEEHLGTCSDCARAAQLFRALKSARQVSTARDPNGREHPALSEIATLFYSKSSRARAQTAAHVAICQSCAEEISEYARAEAAATEYDPAEHASGKVPAAAWEMIREWQESSFAKPRPANEVIGEELLSKLSRLLGDRADWLPRTTSDSLAGVEKTELVPVIVVDRSGELRGVEMFEKVTDSSGAGALRHAAKSERFDNKPVHAFLDVDGKQRIVLYRVRHDTIRFEEAGSAGGPVDYFIIED